MKRQLFLVILASVFFLGQLQHLNAQPSGHPGPKGRSSTASRILRSRSLGAHTAGLVPAASPDTGSGLREVIDPKYRKRYEEWKAEFLSTEIGRAQWELYSHHSQVSLTVTVVSANENGAGSGNYKWNEAGELVAATIVLGNHLDEGYPSSVYYPVMNALEPYETDRLLSRNVLAAAKIAHEIGHVMKIATTPEALYHLQVRLVPQYNKIFLSNGHDVNDPRLVAMAKQMGGNPVEIWEDREYWGEANAMLYLRDRVANERFHCKLFNRIKRTVDEYAKNYEDRFTEIAKSLGVAYSCSWK